MDRRKSGTLFLTGLWFWIYWNIFWGEETGHNGLIFLTWKSSCYICFCGTAYQTYRICNFQGTFIDLNVLLVKSKGQRKVCICTYVHSITKSQYGTLLFMKSFSVKSYFCGRVGIQKTDSTKFLKPKLPPCIHEINSWWNVEQKEMNLSLFPFF